eukprot:gnl/TRDRNA2_/TRDRNA2_187832_c0_seq1.p1 gnl/TRDRNA2_/TRDRNA2_187832_c0~~gnl/TRDRNA2_/TRDRNA2_187832_c0_seq1.p1  ORF type:complete len:277 (-),score=48.71 gnl/TRDRNA2_/TRDRNA2_187832_c0_seq1:186-1016(-)
MDCCCRFFAIFAVAASASIISLQPKEHCVEASSIDGSDELSLLSLLRKSTPQAVAMTRVAQEDTNSLFPGDIKQMILNSALEQHDRDPPNEEKEDFPPMLGQRAFVGSGPQSDRLLWTVIHPWDVAVYLDVTSPLWGKTNSFEDIIAELSSHGTLYLRQRMEIPPLLPVTLLRAEMKRRISESVEPGVAERLVDMMTWGKSSMPKGTVTVYELDESGMSVSINGERRGRIDHSKLNKEAARMYASPISSVRGLGQAIIERLKNGAPVTPSRAELTW